jgi:hypothetical protein
MGNARVCMRRGGYYDGFVFPLIISDLHTCILGNKSYFSLPAVATVCSSDGEFEDETRLCCLMVSSRCVEKLQILVQRYLTSLNTTFKTHEVHFIDFRFLRLTMKVTFLCIVTLWSLLDRFQTYTGSAKKIYTHFDRYHMLKRIHFLADPVFLVAPVPNLRFLWPEDIGSTIYVSKYTAS